MNATLQVFREAYTFLALLLLNFLISLLDLKVKGMNLMGKKNPPWGIIRGSMPQFITSDHRGGGANGAQSILALQ